MHLFLNLWTGRLCFWVIIVCHQSSENDGPATRPQNLNFIKCFMSETYIPKNVPKCAQIKTNSKLQQKLNTQQLLKFHFQVDN